MGRDLSIVGICVTKFPKVELEALALIYCSKSIIIIAPTPLKHFDFSLTALIV